MTGLFKTHYIYILLLVFLALVAMTGGGARDDIQSLAILRPAAVLFLGVGLFGLTRAHIAAFRFPILFAGFCLFAVAIYLVPLPPSLWAAIPNRELAVEAGLAAGIDQPWRPLSLVPWRTWNAFFALTVPIAAMLLAIRATREQRFQLLPILIGFACFSGVFGLLQVIGPALGPLYLYQYTNPGVAVGLFANRNHQAMLLATLFPMLAVYASTGLRSIEHARRRAWASIGIGFFIVPLLIVTGSRGGLVLGAIGLASVPLLYRRPQFSQPVKRKVEKLNPKYIVAGCALLSVALLATVMSKGNAVQRLIAGDSIEDLRFSIWAPIATMAASYFPFGSGPGSFVELYQVTEPLAILSDAYVNHAHNDWLEAALTGGLLSILLMAACTIFWAMTAWKVFRGGDTVRDAAFARLGVVIVLLLGIGSIVDYPLRVPTLSCLFVIALVWMASGARPRYSEDSAAPTG